MLHQPHFGLPSLTNCVSLMIWDFSAVIMQHSPLLKWAENSVPCPCFCAGSKSESELESELELELEGLVAADCEEKREKLSFCVMICHGWPFVVRISWSVPLILTMLRPQSLTPLNLGVSWTPSALASRFCFWPSDFYPWEVSSRSRTGWVRMRRRRVERYPWRPHRKVLSAPQSCLSSAS